MTLERPLRVLMVIHTRWRRDLGGPRAQLELGEQLCRLGCQVSKYSYENAFPESMQESRSSFGALGGILRSNLSFSKRAVAWVRSNSGHFDIIDAHQTDLPVPKTRLGFSGLLVARSVGLIPEYDRFEQWAASRWQQEVTLKHRVHRLLTWPAARRRRRDVLRSFQHADLINVSSNDDLSIVRDRMGFGDKVVRFPLGISDERRAAFDAASLAPELRRRARVVAFIGTWNSRKGSRDWPGIFSRLRVRVPQVKLLLLGTSIAETQVRKDFPADAQSAITVVPSYESTELPRLLAGATVGAFPGYLEGFGFSVLEKLAAGLPTITYDSPGPRDMLERLPRPMMIPRGDVAGFAAAVANALNFPEAEYRAYAEQSRRIAATFSWGEIASATLDTYREQLGRMCRQ